MESRENKLNLLKEFFKPNKRKILIFLALLSFYILSFLFGEATTGRISYTSLFNGILIFILSPLSLLSSEGFVIGPCVIILFIYLFSVLVDFFINSAIKLRNPFIKYISIITIFSLSFIIIVPPIYTHYDNSFSHKEKGWNMGCEKLNNDYNCNPNYVVQIDTGIDLTGDGNFDNLLILCKAKFNEWNATKYFCKNKCCNTPISEDLDCEQDMDCTSAVGGEGWVCDLETNKCKEQNI